MGLRISGQNKLSWPWWIFLCVAGSCLLTGCGSGDGNYQVSGTVTFKGQPVPEGYIVFEPDASKGNSGPPGRSTILAGKYDTRLNDGQGIVGGPHVIRIVGLDGQISPAEGSKEVNLPGPLFPPYEVSEDLPREDITRDFEIPAAR